MKILNLGCGTKVCSSDAVINIDWSIQLRIKRSRFSSILSPIILQGERLDAFKRLDTSNIMVHDLSKGIPFPDDSVDAVYHSHTLEHLDRDVVPKFLMEVKRVLKDGGVQRIVVPDLERICVAYCRHLAECTENPQEVAHHDKYVANLLEQSVQKEAYGTSMQRPLRRFIENALLGDARRRGHTHQWMWDRFNLSHALHEAGFRDVSVTSFTESAIPDWQNYGLDLEGGKEYKPGSLYIEARK